MAPALRGSCARYHVADIMSPMAQAENDGLLKKINIKASPAPALPEKVDIASTGTAIRMPLRERLTLCCSLRYIYTRFLKKHLIAGMVTLQSCKAKEDLYKRANFYTKVHRYNSGYLNGPSQAAYLGNSCYSEYPTFLIFRKRCSKIEKKMDHWCRV